jgi:hypothetical protein
VPRFPERTEEPGQARIHQCHLGSDGANPEAIEWQGRLHTDDSKAAAMDGDKSSRQCANQIGFGNRREGEHEIRDCQRDPARTALLRQELIDEAMGISGQ